MIVIALGANLPSHRGGPRETLDAALGKLAASGVRVASLSSYYVTKAWPDPSDPPYVNAVARVETNLAPRELMTLLHGTEESFGRVRAHKNAPRTLDLDLIDYDSRVESGPPQLPHPRLQERTFVLVPLAEIAPDWRHPASGIAITALLAALKQGEDEIRKLTT